MTTHKLIGTIIGAVALSLAAAAPTHAATGGPTGTIDMLTADASGLSTLRVAAPSYGSSVQFSTTVSGRLASQSTVYVTVVCTAAGVVVYQNSADPSAAFLLEDQIGDNLNWTGGAAECQSGLIYRAQKGKSYEYTLLDTVSFHVDAQL